jgi:sugar lactone lactonase YvrE
VGTPFTSAPATQTLHVPKGSASSYTAGWGSNFTITDDLPAVTLSLTTDNVSLPCTGGNTATVTVTSDMPWVAKTTSDVEWLTISAGSNTLTITAAANTGTDARTATITVEAYDGSTKSITITQAGPLPTVTTQGATGVSQNSATGNGNITSLGSSNPTAYGICYSNTNTTPTIADGKIEKNNATATGPFTVSIAELTPGTLYYARAYATNAAGTAYGDVVLFNTLQTKPAISYPVTSQVFTVGTAATTLTPSNTGGAVPATIPNEVSTFAGSSSGYAEGTGTAAQFNSPDGVATDAAGNVFVADMYNHKIRKITPAGVVTTLAGGSTNGYADGTGTSAKFNCPVGVATDAAGNIFVSDQGNTNIRKITPAGVVTTFAGSSQGYADGMGSSAKFGYPWGIAFDLTGNIFVADYSNSVIRKITPDGTVTTLTASIEGKPYGVATDVEGNVIFLKLYSHSILKITSGGAVSTIAGSSQGYADGTVTEAQFDAPHGVAIDQAGNIFVTDQSNHRIRKISLDGIVTTIAGRFQGSADGIGTSALFSNPLGLTIDAKGNLFVADAATIRKVTPYGYTISPSLPAGLTFDAKTGAISGTPTAASAATNYIITGSNIAGSSSDTIVIEVNNKQKLTVNAPTLTTSKVYDGSNTATVTAGAITTEIGNDEISVSATAQYDNASVGSGKTITVSYTISGAAEAKYAAPDNYVVNTGEITARKLTLKAPVLTTSKTYDGTTTVAVTSGSATNAVSGDEVNATATATYDNANAGTGKTITVTYSLSGSTAANYAVPDDYVVSTGEITRLKLAVNVPTITKSKVYDGTTVADVIPGDITNKIGNDDISVLATAQFYTVSVGSGIIIRVKYSLSGNATANYAAPGDFVVNTGEITARKLTLNDPVLTSKVYDGTTMAVVTPGSATNAVAGDDVNATATATYDNESAGTAKTITVKYALSGNAAANYAAPDDYVVNSGEITPKAITVTANAATKVYGDADPELTFTCSPALIGTNTFGGTLLREDGENVGNYPILQASLYAGSNYTISFVSKDFAITAKQLMVGAPSIKTSKTYDGTASATVSAGTLTNRVTDDDVAILASATYDNANVGTGKTIIVSYSLSGSKAVNYTVPDNYTVTNGEIKAVQLSIANPTVVTMKVYDGSTSAAVTSVGQLSGVISSDLANVNASAQASYNDALAGTNKTITVVYSLTGSSAGNYLAPANFTINGAQILEKTTLATLTSPEAVCGNSGIMLFYNVLTGNPVQYRIVFDPKAVAAGFTDIDFTDLPMSSENGLIFIPVPEGIAEGSYTASLQMKDALNNTGELYPFSFSINLPADYIISKFGDVVLCNNVSNRFTAYQWYKNGKAISGATNQFYNDTEGLTGNYYYVQVVTTSGETLMSCAKSFQVKKSAKVTVSAFPNPVSSNQPCSVKISGLSDDDLQDAVLSVYNLQGQRVYYTSEVQLLNDLSIQLNNGVYVGHVTTANGSDYTFRIIVTK